MSMAFFITAIVFMKGESRVPLIIRPPGELSNNKTVPGPVRNMDIMPTILDYRGILLPNDLDGQSLRGAVEEDITPNLPTCLESNTPE